MESNQAQQRAERLVEKLNRLRADIQGGYETADSPVTIIAAELLAVQRETKLEMIEWYRVHGDDTDDPRYAIREGQHE